MRRGNRILQIVFIAIMLMIAINTRAEGLVSHGNVWEVTSEAMLEDFFYTDYEYVFGEEVEIDGFQAYEVIKRKVSDKREYKEFVIRQDGDKVWIHRVSGNEGWKLLYDFAIKPGEERTVVLGDVGNEFHEYTVKCLDILEIEGISQPVYLMHPYNPLSDDRKDDNFFDFYWIKGIGSEMGLLRNIPAIDRAGTDVQTLNKVTDANGNIIFDSKTLKAGVNTVATDNKSSADNRIYNLDGTVTTEPQPGKIYVRNGQKIIFQ